MTLLSHSSRSRQSDLYMSVANTWRIPPTFDWRVQADIDKKYSAKHSYYIDQAEIPQAATLISPTIAQLDCGSCWAIASTALLESRTRLFSDEYVPSLSYKEILTCTENKSNGCLGGDVFSAFTFMETNGIGTSAGFTEHCTQRPEACQKPCIIDTFDTRYYAQKYSAKYIFTDRLTTSDMLYRIRLEIYANGPVVATFIVYTDFMSKSHATPDELYVGSMDGAQWEATNGIYIHGAYGVEDNSDEGGHAVLVVGWGVGTVPGYENPVPYWIFQNSWGREWGVGGYGKIAMTSGILKINSTVGFDVPMEKGGLLYGGIVVCQPRTTVFSSTDALRNRITLPLFRVNLLKAPYKWINVIFVISLIIVVGLLLIGTVWRISDPHISTFLVGTGVMLLLCGIVGAFAVFSQRYEQALTLSIMIRSLLSSDDDIEDLALSYLPSIDVLGNLHYPSTVRESSEILHTMIHILVDELATAPFLFYFIDFIELWFAPHEMMRLYIQTNNSDAGFRMFASQQSRRVFGDNIERVYSIEPATQTTFEVTKVQMITTPPPHRGVPDHFGGGWLPVSADGSKGRTYALPLTLRATKTNSYVIIQKRADSGEFLTLQDFYLLVRANIPIIALFTEHLSDIIRYDKKKANVPGYREVIVILDQKETTSNATIVQYIPTVAAWKDGVKILEQPFNADFSMRQFTQDLAEVQ
jgi:hypothetical protein